MRHVLISLGILVASSATAVAGDAIHFVCSGIAPHTDQAAAVGISIDYRDTRNKDGGSRDVVMRELVGDTVFKASHVSSEALDAPINIVLASRKLVRFRGSYTLSDRVLHLVGTVGKLAVDVKLPCVDLST